MAKETVNILWNKKVVSKTLIQQQILHRKKLQAVYLRLYKSML